MSEVLALDHEHHYTELRYIYDRPTNPAHNGAMRWIVIHMCSCKRYVSEGFTYDQPDDNLIVKGTDLK